MGKKTDKFMTLLGNNSAPTPHRASMLIDVLAKAQSGDPACITATEELFSRLENSAVDAVARERSEQLKEILNQLEDAPLRPATFVRSSDVGTKGTPHALVIMENGDMTYIVAPDQSILSNMKQGGKLLVDVKGKIMVRPLSDDIHTGVEGYFIRKVDDCHIELRNQQDEKVVVLAAQEVIDKIDAKEVLPGAAVVVGGGGKLATFALPVQDKNTDHFRFLDRGHVPDVVVERDIGCPPPVISQVALHIREEMMRPNLRRKFKLRPCISKLLFGVTGTGKTLAVQAIHRQMYEIMSEVTGTPIDKLPPRVFKFRSSQMLSMWLGESDKNADRIFDEVESMAAQPYTNARGIVFDLPVLVVMEEADGMGRARGDEAIYDRIMTTILQRLDPNRRGLSDKLVIFLSTTNEPKLVDPAFLRRIGGSVERFSGLSREAFRDVFRKQVDGLPAVSNGDEGKKAWNHIAREVDDWLWSSSTGGVVELYFRGADRPLVRHHRDFLTGALIDRSVQQAATEAWEQTLIADEECGITLQYVMNALNCQVANIVNHLSAHNASHYLDLPEGSSVNGIRSLIKDA